MTPALRVHRIPFSTNVERVALACAYKGLSVEWADHDAADRSELRALSGQELVPVLEADGEVVVDSPVILDWIDEHHPQPPLYPRAPARKAEVKVFIEWFNRVWKGPPNLLTDEPGRGDAQSLRASLRASVDLFDDLLEGRSHLLGDELTMADVVAFPFLRYPVLGLPAGDEEPFHRVLVEAMPLAERHGRLRDWVQRMDRLPRA